MTQVIVNGNRYSDDGSTSKDMNSGGFRQNLLPMIGDTLIDTSAKVAAAAHQVELAEAAAETAAVAASTAVSGPGSTGSSTTSLTIGLGVQALIIQANKTLAPGMPCTIASAASPRNWMNGSIDSYNPATGSLQVNVTNIGLVTPGVYPTLAAWSISLSGPAAVTGVLNELKGGAIASAAAVNLDAATGNYLHLTGSAGPIATITLAQGAEREVTFDGTPVLAHSASLDLPTKANIQAQAGDIARFRGEGGGVVRVTSWTRANGRPLALPPVPVPGLVLLAGPISPTAALNLDFLTIFSDTAYDAYLIRGQNVRPSGVATLQVDTLSLSMAVAGAVDNSGHLGFNGPQSNPLGLSATLYISSAENGNATSSAPSAIAALGCNFELTISRVLSPAALKPILWEYVSSDDPRGYFGHNSAGAYYSGGVPSGFRLNWVSGSAFVASGAISIYGYNKF